MFPSLRAIHGLPALAALLTAGILLAGLEAGAGSRLRRFGPALASLNLPEETRGTVLQRRVFAMPACLPVYGSSELTVAQGTRADLFFGRKRQGFDVRVIGQAGDHCLNILQELAALGDTVRGRKVALFLSPAWFVPPPEARQRERAAHHRFAAAFSPLQAGRIAADRTLDPGLKRDFAARLLSYDPVIRQQSPLLDFALANLREPGWTRRCLSAAVTPLLALQNEILAVQERCRWLELARSRAARRAASGGFRPRHKRWEWTRLDREVDRMESKRTHATFYSRGPDPASSPELRRARRLADHPDDDADFLRRMDASPEWSDLDLLLRVARARGIRLLLVGQPINGLFSDHQGVTAQARQEYYRRVSSVAAANRVPLRDFSDHEEDRAFFMDLVHPSAEAWLQYDRVLQDFFQHRHS